MSEGLYILGISKKLISEQHINLIECVEFYFPLNKIHIKEIQES